MLVDCPELSREQAAEIESRVRASLLTAEVRAAIAVTCQSGEAEVRASTEQESASRRLKMTPELRDDVLRAVDELLDELGHHPAPTEAPPQAAASSSGPTNVAPTPPPPAPAEVPAPSRDSAPSAPPPLASAPVSTEPFASLAGEAWPDRLAAGLFLGVRRGRPLLRYGVRGGAFRPLSSDSGFGITELSLAASLEVGPAFSRGLRLALAAGPSWLWVSPNEPITARTSGRTVALCFDAELSRPLWLGDFALVPALGVRWFTAERGVRLNGYDRFELRGFAPRVALSLMYDFASR